MTMGKSKAKMQIRNEEQGAACRMCEQNNRSKRRVWDMLSAGYFQFGQTQLPEHFILAFIFNI